MEAICLPYKRFSFMEKTDKNKENRNAKNYCIQDIVVAFTDVFSRINLIMQSTHEFVYLPRANLDLLLAPLRRRDFTSWRFYSVGN